MQFKRFLSRAALFFSGALLFAAPTFAASTYDVVQTTGTVGTAVSLELEYTVDTAAQTWADADTLTIAVPANIPNWASLTYTAEYDSDVNNNGTGETAITAGGGNGQYAVSTNTLTIKWDVTSWGAVSNGASTIRVLITAGAVPQYAGTTTFTFGGTTANGGDTNPSGTDAITVSASDAAASITLSNPSVGASGSNITTLTLTTSIDMAANDTVVFTVPSHLVLNNMSGTATDTFGGAGSFTCTRSGQVITCTASDTITAGTGTIILSGIYADAGKSSQTLSSLAVNDTSAAGADISSDDSGSVTDTVGGQQHNTATTTTVVVEEEEAASDDSEETSTTDAEEENTAESDDSGTDDETSTTDAEEDVMETTLEEETETTSASDHEFMDVPGDHFAATAIEAMTSAGIVEGNPDGSFAPNNTLNRAEAAQLFDRVRSALGLPANGTGTRQFNDVKANEWYAGAIQRLHQLEVVRGNPDGSYHPGEAINRAEFVTLALRLYILLGGNVEGETGASFMDVNSSDWFASDVTLAANLGFVEGRACTTGTGNCYFPGDDITRAEAVTILSRMFGELL